MVTKLEKSLHWHERFLLTFIRSKVCLSIENVATSLSYQLSYVWRLSPVVSPPGLTLCNTSYKWLALVEKTTTMKQVNLTSQHHKPHPHHTTPIWRQKSMFCCRRESKSQLVAFWLRKLKENKGGGLYGRLFWEMMVCQAGGGGIIENVLIKRVCWPHMEGYASSQATGSFIIGISHKSAPHIVLQNYDLSFDQK